MKRASGSIAIALLTVCHSLLAADLYVATTGDDQSPGTREQPFATLERAREAVRRLVQRGSPPEPITVNLRGGTYPIATTLTLGSEDSGTPTAPIVWQAADGEEVRLCGGVVVPVDALEPVRDEAVLSRLVPEARASVVQADLHRCGISDLATYPDAFRGAPAVPELFFNDRRMTPARWPNDGWATIARIIDPGSVPREGDTSARPGTFEYSGDQPARWQVDAGIWLLGYWCFDWYEEAIRVQSIDREQRQITLARPALYGINPGNPSPRRFRAFNLLEELDAPGEYYLDSGSNRLYFWPPGDLQDAHVVLSMLNAPLVALHDASFLTWRGCVFEASLGDGLEVAGGRGNRIASCEIRNTRQMGIRITGGAEHQVEGCRIHHIGTGGLLLEGGDRRTLTPAGHQAVNNHIWRFSEHQLSYACGITLSGVGNRAAHNLLQDAPHIAIGIAGNDHLFEFNIVRDICTASDDAGALYKGRNPSCRGNVIRYNYWRDIGSPMGHGTAAVYFDDGDGGDTVFGNIFVRCGYPGRGSFGTVFSHGGHDNTAENNIFIECQRALGSAPWDDARWKDAVEGGQDCHWQTRLLQEVDITRPPYTTRYPELVGFMDPQPGQPRVNHARNNVLVRCAEVSSGNWTYAPDEIWSIEDDPGFVDAAAENYLLRPDAEVFRRLPGFQPIPYDQIGPQTDALHDGPAPDGAG